MSQTKITYSQYANRLKMYDPSISKLGLSDELLAKRYLQFNPDHKSVIQEESLSELYSPGIEARGDDSKFAKYQFQEMMSGIPSAVAGGIGAVTGNQDIINYSERLRKEQQEKSKERLEDPELLGYLQWIEQEPVTLSNMFQGKMIQRGLAQAAPSVATMIFTDIGLGLLTGGASTVLTKGAVGLRAISKAKKTMAAAKKAGTPIPKSSLTPAMKIAKAEQGIRTAGTMTTMGLMEGSEQYNSTMDYLISEGVDVEQANKVASIAGATYGALSGILEYIPYGKFKQRLGIGSVKNRVEFEKRIVQALKRRGGWQKGKTFTKDMIEQAFLESGTEYAQYLTSSLIDYYVKKGYSEVPEEALQELKDAFTSSEARESAYSGGVMGTFMGGFGGGVSAFSTKSRLDLVREDVKNLDLSEEEVQTIIEDKVDEIVEESPASSKVKFGAFLGDYSNMTSEEKDIAQELTAVYRDNSKKAVEDVVEAVKDEPKLIQEMSEEDRFDLYEQLLIEDPDFDTSKLEQLIEPQAEEEQTIKKEQTEVKDTPVEEPKQEIDELQDEPSEEGAVDITSKVGKPKKKLTKKDLDRVNITYEDGEFEVKVDKKVVEDLQENELDALQSGIAAMDKGEKSDVAFEEASMSILNRIDEPVEPKQEIDDVAQEEEKALDITSNIGKPKENITQLRKRAKDLGIKNVTKKKEPELLEEIRVLEAVEAKTMAETPEVFEDQEERNTDKATLNSGGAIGADTIFEKAAKAAGHVVKAMSFKGHDTKSKNRIKILPDFLKAADKFIEKANKALKRKIPTKQYVKNLLRRNYYQVKDVNQVIAVGHLTPLKNQVRGGTGWAVQMSIDLGRVENKMAMKDIHVFDLAKNEWTKWNGKTFVKAEPPVLSDNYAGIGARPYSKDNPFGITKEGEAAILDLYRNLKTTPKPTTQEKQKSAQVDNLRSEEEQKESSKPIIEETETIEEKKEKKKQVLKEEKQELNSTPKEDSDIFDDRTDSKEFNYTKGQKNALSKIADYIKSKTKDYFVFAGYAGTGKTTVVENIVNNAEKNKLKVFVAAPTNKATVRLAEKAEDKYEANFKTLHSLMYGAPNEDTGEWEAKIDLSSEDIVIIDEASMIDDFLWKDIQENIIDVGAKVILIGDGFQLAPVGSDPKLMQKYNQKGYQLTNVVRQAAESAVIKFATALRSTGSMFMPQSSQGEVSILNNQQLAQQYFEDIKNNKDSILIVNSNKTRVIMNQKSRAAKFGEESNKSFLLEGEKLITVNNSQYSKNGETSTITKINELSEPFEVDYVKGFGQNRQTNKIGLLHYFDEFGRHNFLAPYLEDASLHGSQITQSELSEIEAKFPGTVEKTRSGKLMLSSEVTINTWGYAITAHKSQGSQWENVFVAQSNPYGDKESQARWLYTAITRTSDKLYMVKDIAPTQSWGQISDILNKSESVNNDNINEKLQEVSKGQKIENNKELAAKIAARLEKQFPFIDANAVERVYNRFGREVAGRAIDSMVEWSLTKGTLDTIPHEYAHIYVDLLRNMPIIKQGIQKFRDEGDTLDRAEEKLVQYIGEYYADRIQVESLKKKMGIWLKQFWLSIKKSFANLNKDEIGSYLAEKFYQDSISKQTIATAGKERLQLLAPDSDAFVKTVRTLENGFNSFKSELRKNNFITKGKLDQDTTNDLISTYLEKLDINPALEPALLYWQGKNKYQEDGSNIIQFNFDDSVEFFGNYAEIYNELLTTIDTKDINFKSLNKTNATFLKGLGVISDKDRKRLFIQAKSVKNDFDNFIEILSKIHLKKPLNEITKTELNKARIFYNSANSSVNVNRKLSEQHLVQRKTLDGTIKEDGDTYSLSLQRKTDVDSEGKSNPRFTVKLLAENLGISLDDIEVLSGKDLKFLEAADPYGMDFNITDRYDALTVEQLKALQIEAAKQDLVLFFNRGENENFYFAKITKEDIENGKDAKNYWELKKQANPNYYTQKHIFNFIGKRYEGKYDKKILDKWRASEIARDRALEKIFPGYLNYDGGTVFKRGKLPLTPTVTSDEMPNQIGRIFDKNKATFVTNGKAVSAITGRDGKTYILDGSTLSSTALFKNFRKYFGMKDESSKAKTVIMVNNDNGLLLVKHQHFQPLHPTSIYENYGTKDEKLIAKIDEEGFITNKDGGVLHVLMTEDEAKVFTGDYQVGSEFTIPGNSFGMIKMPDKKNNSTRTSMQLFNYIHDSRVLNAWKEEMLPILEDRLRKQVFMVSRFERQSNPVKRIAQFFNLLSKGDNTIPDSSFEMFKNGLGFHKFGRTLLDKLMQTQFVQESTKFGKMKGLRGDTISDITGTLKYKEISVAFSDASSIISDYNKAVGNSIGTKVTKEEVNKWLETADYQMLITRSPVPHINGGAMVRIHSLHDKAGQVHLNEELLFVDLEGDGDGDSVAIEKLPPKLEKEMIRMYKGLEVKSIDLSKYQDNQRKYDMSNKNDVFELINAITTGQNAVSEIANVQMVYGMLQETLDDISVSSIESGDYSLSVRDGSQVITDPNSGIRDTVDNILRIYLQASVDNVEYLLLKDWNYSKNNLLSILVEKSNGEEITNVDTAIMDAIYSKLKTVSSIREGRDFKKGAYSFSDTIAKSSEYNHFAGNKNIQIMEEFAKKSVQLDGVSVFANFKRINANEFALHPHEQVAVSISKMYDKYIKPYHDGSPFMLHENIYYNAHLSSVNSMADNKRILKESNEDISRGIEYGKDLSLQLNELFKKKDKRTIDSFNTDADLINLSNDFQQRFRSLNDINKKVATYVYFTEGVRINNIGKIVKISEQGIIPPVSDNSQSLSLLDVGVLKEYLGHYNNSIKEMVMSEIDYTDKKNTLKNIDRVVMMQTQVVGNNSVKKDIERNC